MSSTKNEEEIVGIIPQRRARESSVNPLQSDPSGRQLLLTSNRKLRFSIGSLYSDGTFVLM